MARSGSPQRASSCRFLTPPRSRNYPRQLAPATLPKWMARPRDRSPARRSDRRDDRNDNDRRERQYDYHPSSQRHDHRGGPPAAITDFPPTPSDHHTSLLQAVGGLKDVHGKGSINDLIYRLEPDLQQTLLVQLLGQMNESMAQRVAVAPETDSALNKHFAFASRYSDALV